MTDPHPVPVDSLSAAAGRSPTRSADWRGTAFVDGGRSCRSPRRGWPLTDFGFTRSDATYDIAHVWHRRFFRLEDHLDRFERSLAALRLRIPY